MGIVDLSRRITKDAANVFIPITAGLSDGVALYGTRVSTGMLLPPRHAPRNVKSRIHDELVANRIPISAAANGWRLIGDVLVIRIPPEGRAHAKEMATIFARQLCAKTVLEDISGVHGALRTPDMRVLLGDDTETLHVEGGVRYRFDVARVMFSPGNVAERMGIADHVRPGDVVVDLFAGIGYFSLPIAVRARPAAVYACELNPVSFGYLKENIRMNRADRVIPLLGDCRSNAPEGVADWVIMGHFAAREYLDVAFRCLRGKGTIVYHELCPKEQVPEQPIARIAEAARKHWMRVGRVEHRIVKSYAPGIVHVSVQAHVEPEARRRTERHFSGRPSPTPGRP